MYRKRRESVPLREKRAIQGKPAIGRYSIVGLAIGTRGVSVRRLPVQMQMQMRRDWL